jgi:hypothetical protein
MLRWLFITSAETWRSTYDKNSTLWDNVYVVLKPNVIGYITT